VLKVRNVTPIEQRMCALKKGTQLNSSGRARLLLVKDIYKWVLCDTCGYCVRL
jgi:hypothetical protein